MRSHKIPKTFTLLLILGNLFFAPMALAESHTQEVCSPITENDVAHLFDRWNNTLKSKNLDNILANYAHDAILLPTLSNTPRVTPEERREYFVDFLKKNPVGHIDQRVIRMGCDWATDSGIYTFTLSSHDKTEQAKARYSYVYEYIDGKWLIIAHHSSLLPEAGE